MATADLAYSVMQLPRAKTGHIVRTDNAARDWITDKPVQMQMFAKVVTAQTATAAQVGIAAIETATATVFLMHPPPVTQNPSVEDIVSKVRVATIFAKQDKSRTTAPARKTSCLTTVVRIRPWVAMAVQTSSYQCVQHNVVRAAPVMVVIAAKTEAAL